MVSCIHVLPDAIANQIAAGEVVERPSSIVKELVENALDAGSDRIDVSILEGGLSRIVVSDNGIGMTPQDAVLCFARHATSKIQAANDLLAIKTFGFRGEALAAIASVSRVSLVTRQKQADNATQVVVEGGQVKHVGPTRGNFGTRIEVSDLFFNVPARLKFLRSTKSEASQIDDVVRDVALAQPGVAFSLRQQSILRIDVSKSESMAEDARKMQRLVTLLGEECQNNLYRVDLPMDRARLTGYVASPLVSRRDNKGIRLFVNGRVVQDRNLSMAVQIAYRTLLEIGRKPICALNIEIDPHLVDVNVHPQKAEVRFQEEIGIQSQIIRTLQSFLSTTPWLVKAPTKTYTLKPFSEPEEVFAAMPRAAGRSGMIGWNLPSEFRPTPVEVPRPLLELEKRYFKELRIIGQIDQTYLLLDDGNGLVLVDQHAAHERVLFERFRENFAKKSLIGQPLLFPKQIKLTAADMQALEDQKEFLSSFGLDVENFGEDVAILRAVPTGLSEHDAETMVKEFLADAVLGKVSTSLAHWVDKICAQMACHGSVRAGQSLNQEQIQALLVELDDIDYSAHCPHGRPTTKVVSYNELAKWFHRL